MTHSGGKPHTNVGDRGQRYEVTFVWIGKTAPRVVFGWADDHAGAEAMCRSIELHPSMMLPECRDREAGNG